MTARLPNDSGEAHILSEIVGFKKRGHEVLVVPAVRRGTPVHANAHALLADSKIEPLYSLTTLKSAARRRAQLMSLADLVVTARAPRIALKNAVSLPKAAWVADLAEQWRADHLHASWASVAATIALAAGRMTGIGWSFSAHRWDIAEDNLLALKMREAAFARFISEDGKQRAERITRKTSPSAFVLHLGVPPISEVAEAPVRQDDVVRLATVARLVPFKGHTVLFAALRKVRDEGLKIQLDVLGEGPLRDDLEREAADLPGVRFEGLVPHESVIASMRERTWDAMVLPSIVPPGQPPEGIPVALMEAMNAGMPVASTRTGGIPELLGGGAGLLFEPDDADDLARVLRILATDAEARGRLSRNGKACVALEFNQDRVLDVLEQRFAEAVHHH